MKISVVLPAYNEEGNVVELTKRLTKVLNELKIEHEILYIIQGKDGALEKLEEMRKNLNTLKIIYHEEPIGVGPAFVEGFKNISAEFDYILTMDADLNHQPEEIDRFIDAINKNDCGIVIGSRKIKGGIMLKMPFLKKIISGFTNILIPLMYGFKVKDMTSGYRLFKREVIEAIRDKITSRNFEFYPEVLIEAKKAGYSMVEVPITFKFREHGKSKLNWVKSGFGYLRLLAKRFKSN